MGQRLKTEKMKKSDLDHNALIFKKTKKVCDDIIFSYFKDVQHLGIFYSIPIE